MTDQGAIGAPGSEQEDGAMQARIETPTPVMGCPRDATGQPPVRTAFLGLLTILASWQERWAQRRALETLDDRAMRDLALSRADIHREASKPFWKR